MHDPHEIETKTSRRVGAKIMGKWMEIVGEDHSQRKTGALLVSAVIDMGHGDKHDLQATVTDIVAYLGHHAIGSSVDFAECCERARSANPNAHLHLETLVRSLPDTIVRCLTDVRVYCENSGLSYDDAARVGRGHVEAESANDQLSPSP